MYKKGGADINKFLFPVFGIHSKNKILHVDSKLFLQDRKIQITLHKNDIRSIILQTYKYPDQIGITNYILSKLIYPINFNLSSEKLKMYIIDDKKANIITPYNLPKKHVIGWQIPLGLYLYKVLNENECDIFTKCIISFFKKLAPDKMKLKYCYSMNIHKNLKYGFESMAEMLYWTKQDKNLHAHIESIIHKFFKILYGHNYKNEYDTDKLYKSFAMVIAHFTGHSDGNSSGLKLHTDRLGKMAASSVITLENSILDFVPWGEIFKKKDSFRVIIPKGYMIIFDGDIRHYYTHGVPLNIKYPNNIRCSINFRHPLLNPEKNTNCTGQFNDIPELSKIKCISSSYDNPLQLI
jgi:hypothetical protein